MITDEEIRTRIAANRTAMQEREAEARARQRSEREAALSKRPKVRAGDYIVTRALSESLSGTRIQCRIYMQVGAVSLDHHGLPRWYRPEEIGPGMCVSGASIR